MPQDYSQIVTEKPPQEYGAAARWSALIGAALVWNSPFLALLALAVVAVLMSGEPDMLVFFVGWAPWLLICAFFVVFSVQRAVMRRRRRNGQLIVGYLDTAVRLNLPLNLFLAAAEQSEKGRTRRQIAALRQWLETGMPVSASLPAATDVSHETIARVAAAEPIGQMGMALARELRRQQVEDQERAGGDDKAFYRFYPLMMVVAVTMIVFLFTIFVVPRFRDIFQDFRAKLPPATEHLLWISNFMEENSALALVLQLLIVAAIMLAIGFHMTRVFMPRVPVPRFREMGEFVGWRLPLVHGLFHNRAMGEICELLAGALENGVPLPAALQRAAVLPIHPEFKPKLQLFRDGLLQGKSAAQAAADADLPEILAGMLQSPGGAGAEAGPGENQNAKLFAFLARYYRQRFSRTLMLLRAASEPFIVLCFGGLVLYVVLALFQPLVFLIQKVAGDGGSF